MHYLHDRASTGSIFSVKTEGWSKARNRVLQVGIFTTIIL